MSTANEGQLAMLFDTVLDRPPDEEEGDDSINAPDDAETVTEDDMEDAPELPEDDDDDIGTT